MALREYIKVFLYTLHLGLIDCLALAVDFRFRNFLKRIFKNRFRKFLKRTFLQDGCCEAQRLVSRALGSGLTQCIPGSRLRAHPGTHWVHGSGLTWACSGLTAPGSPGSKTHPGSSGLTLARLWAHGPRLTRAHPELPAPGSPGVLHINIYIYIY